MSDRFAVKQLGSLVGNIADWPGDLKVYSAMVATAVAPVAAIPTTAAHASLWNSYPTGSGKNMVILQAGTIITTTAGAAIVLNLLGCVTTVRVATQTGTAASTIVPLSGTDAYPGGAATFLSAVTIVNNGLWMPITPALVCAGTANIGASVVTPPDFAGRYVVTPGQQFCLASFCSAAGTATCQPYVIWAEATFN